MSRVPQCPQSVRLFYRCMRYLGQVAFVLYFRGRVFGVENVPDAGGVLLACNHQSFFDPISAAIALQRDCSFMARDTLFKNPLFARLICSVNAFPIKRGAGDIGAVKEILRRLKAGRVVLVFAEGTRTRDGLLGRINPNSLAIAKKAGAAIVPTIIDGAFEAWPRTQRFPRCRATHVTYAEPLLAQQVRDWSNERLVGIVAERWKVTLALSKSRRRRARMAPPSL